MNARSQPVRQTNWRLTLAYDGRAFHGWQRQEGLRTVQGELEAVLRVLARGEVFAQGAGRTDAGVHAAGQVATCAFASTLTADKLQRALAALLPPDLAAVSVEPVAAGFSAKQHSVGKRYLYRVLNRVAPDPFAGPYRWHLRGNLDVEAMQEGALHLIGEHDFESFRSTHCQAEHARRYLWKVGVTRRHDEIEIEVRGNAFCRNMVRIIAGTLVEVGQGRFAPADVATMLAAKSRPAAGRTAPAEGLLMAQVYYPHTVADAAIPPEASFPGYPVSAQEIELSRPLLAHPLSDDVVDQGEGGRVEVDEL